MPGNSRPSMTRRVIWAKIIGLVIGICGLLFTPYIIPGADMTLKIGVLLWYVTLAAMIGLGGIYTWHPVLKIKIAWWWRGPLFGSWFNFVLLMLAYDAVAQILENVFGSQTILSSPWWLVAEGAAIGFFIDAAITYLAGDGPRLVDDDR